uniref:Secreted protein n=1 Tax=Bursaphelenchus xylophilus TaxID=6326 RepID=A0A1I7RH53_BURXY
MSVIPVETGCQIHKMLDSLTLSVETALFVAPTLYCLHLNQSRASVLGFTSRPGHTERKNKRNNLFLSALYILFFFVQIHPERAGRG